MEDRPLKAFLTRARESTGEHGEVGKREEAFTCVPL